MSAVERAMVDVTAVTPLAGTVVILNFDDGATRIVDLSPFMEGPIFDELRESGLQGDVSVDEELGTIVWPNGADLPAERLRYEAPTASLTDLLHTQFDRSDYLIGFRRSSAARVMEVLKVEGFIEEPRVPEAKIQLEDWRAAIDCVRAQNLGAGHPAVEVGIVKPVGRNTYPRLRVPVGKLRRPSAEDKVREQQIRVTISMQ